MSLIIEGMDMPEYVDVYGDGQNKCVYLLMLNVRKDGTASMQFIDVDGGFHRVKEVPTSHGRLIDANYINGSGLIDWQKSIVKAEISQAPTVIEAEGVNE